MLSVRDPIESLPLLLEALDMLSPSFLGGRGITKEAGRWSALRGGGEDFAGGVFELDTDARRRTEVWPFDGRLSATTLETETDGVEGVTVGRRTPRLRRGDTGVSKSRFLRLGEEWDECGPSTCFSEMSRCAWRRCPWCCSIVDAVGTEEEMEFPLEFRDIVFATDIAVCFGLPPGRPREGIDMDGDFPERLLDLEGLALPLFLRSKDGIEGLLLPPLLLPPLAGKAGVGLPLIERLSNAALISGGMDTW